MFAGVPRHVVIGLWLAFVSGMADSSHRNPLGANTFTWSLGESDASIFLARGLMMASGLKVYVDHKLVDRQWLKAHCSLVASRPNQPGVFVMDHENRLGCEVTLTDLSVGWITWQMDQEPIGNWGDQNYLSALFVSGDSAEMLQRALRDIASVESDQGVITQASLTNLNNGIVHQEVALRVPQLDQFAGRIKFRCLEGKTSQPGEDIETRCIFMSFDRV